jgi:hypothetical protein
MPHQLPLRSGEDPYRGKEVDITKYTRLGYITRVDYETGYVDITWLEGRGFTPFVRLPLSHASLRSTIRGMPEVGSVVICGWSRQSQTWEDPVILGFTDFSLETLLEYRLLRNDKTSQALTDIATIREKIGYNVIRGKRRKIYPGEIQIESSPGAELYLDEDVYLSDSKLNEIEIRSADKSIRLSSNQIYTLTQASRTWNGLVAREPGDLKFNFQPTTLPNGQKVQFVTDSNNPLHVGGQAFTEHRIEMYETSNGIMKASEVNAGYDVNAQQPFLTYVLGTLVGNDKTDIAKYAKVLRPQIFGIPFASEVSLDYLECTPEEYSKLSSAVSLKLLSRARIDIDKEGHLFTFFPASSGAHSLGAGRSWEGAFEGAVKLLLGADNVDNKSLYLDTKGGIKATLGYDREGKSSNIVAQKGMYVEVIAPGNDGNSYYLKTKGPYKGLIDGPYNLEVTGDYNVVVHGKYIVQSLGTREESFVNDKNNMYGGSYKKIVIKDKQEQIGYNRDTRITGSLERAPGIFTPALPSQITDGLLLTTGTRDEKYLNGNLKRTILLGDEHDTIVKGNMVEDLTLGDKTTSVKVGNINQNIINGSSTEAIVNGSKKISIKSGSFVVEIVAGDVQVKTSLGAIKINSIAQTVDINGALVVTIKSGVKLNLSGPLVQIGSLPAVGGVVTGLPTPTHLDFVVGLPLLASKTVSASM